MSVNLFDADFYQTNNPDLPAAGLKTEKKLFSHLQKHGLSEGRSFSPLINLNYYKQNNADLAEFDSNQLLAHLQKHGVAEGRPCSPIVDLNFYRANYSDLANLNNQELFEHLRIHGIAEGRKFSQYVDIDYYLANNSDVDRAFSGNRVQAFQHLQTFGFREGRQFSPNFKFDTALNSFVSADATNVVIDWNRSLLDAIKVDRTAPPAAARNMAIVHTAIYDAVNAIAKAYKPYLVQAEAPAYTSPEAAAAAAAHRTLVNLYPKQKATFDAAFASSLAQITDGKSENDGVTLGQFVADQILASRSNDGSKAQVPYTALPNAGIWQATLPSFQSALLPQWPNVTPFAMTSGSQFRPAGPPELNTAEYTAELNQVKELGKKDSLTRTPEQTEIAEFWADGAGTYTPPGHWNKISEEISLIRGNSLLEDARLFALLNIGLADAGIAAWDAKYVDNFWRPLTAIRQADIDNNPETNADPNWEPLLVTPPFPEYVSGHSTFSGAADAILTSVFAENTNFSSSNEVGEKIITRSFNSFSQAANEAGMSRIYGGIHFLSANEDGLAAGRALGNYVINNFLTPNPIA